MKSRHIAPLLEVQTLVLVRISRLITIRFQIHCVSWYTLRHTCKSAMPKILLFLKPTHPFYCFWTSAFIILSTIFVWGVPISCDITCLRAWRQPEPSAAGTLSHLKFSGIMPNSFDKILWVLSLYLLINLVSRSRRNPLGLIIALDDNKEAKGELFWDNGETIGEHCCDDIAIPEPASLRYSFWSFSWGRSRTRHSRLNHSRRTILFLVALFMGSGRQNHDGRKTHFYLLAFSHWPATFIGSHFIVNGNLKEIFSRLFLPFHIDIIPWNTNEQMPTIWKTYPCQWGSENTLFQCVYL